LSRLQRFGFTHAALQILVKLHDKTFGHLVIQFLFACQRGMSARKSK
jgi:hypothetical protein